MSPPAGEAVATARGRSEPPFPLRSRKRRRVENLALEVASTAAALLALFFLFWILAVVVKRGISALDWTFFTSRPAPPGAEGGGLANAILGTVAMTLMAALIGTPLGVLTGVYLSEFGKGTRFASLVRFTVNVMLGIPSILAGLFVYTLLVVTTGHFSGWAGGVSLAVLILPNVARTTEDMLGLVPDTLRESSLALGAPRWKTTAGIVFRAARSGLATGILLAVARISGETAPLLFTALNSPYWPRDLGRPTANLTVTIFNYAMSPYSDWQRLAWGASLLITVSVLVVTLLTRWRVREEES
ncbi:MAG TPA: phosphate ABC transporter permease PstA [Gemmatimonadota bacterium]|nr:phosphate ABC transporter permease PstA [Gemmatimonadota bacterium]